MIVWVAPWVEILSWNWLILGFAWAAARQMIAPPRAACTVARVRPFFTRKPPILARLRRGILPPMLRSSAGWSGVLFVSLAVLGGCSSGNPAAPSPDRLWSSVTTLMSAGTALPGSLHRMYGARMADYYTVDRASRAAAQIAAGGVARVRRFPRGSLLIKENFNRAQRLMTVTAMLKVPGYDATDRDWLMAAFNANGQPLAFGRVAACINCHAIVRRDDFVFPPLDHLPPSLVRAFFPGQPLSPQYLKFFSPEGRGAR